MNQKKTECIKIFELSKFQIFVNKRFKTTLNTAVNHSDRPRFSKAKKLSHFRR